MEDTKKTNYLTIILTILLIIAVGVIGYSIGTNNSKENKLNNNETKEESKQENANANSENSNEESIMTPIAYTPKCIDASAKQTTLMSDIDTTKYNNIFEYLKQQQNLTISLNYCNDDLSTDDIIEGDHYILNENEKSVVLDEMKNSAVEISKSGIGGVCVSSLEIKYERNNKEYY